MNEVLKGLFGVKEEDVSTFTEGGVAPKGLLFLYLYLSAYFGFSVLSGIRVGAERKTRRKGKKRMR